MSNKYSCVLFDLDGTILDSNKLIIESFKHTLKKHLSLEVTDEEIYRYFGEPLRITLARYDENKLEEMLITYRKFNNDKHDELAAIFPGATEVIEELASENIKLGIVTSKLRRSALKGVELTGVANLIETVVAYEDTTLHKPDPSPVLKALNQLNHSTENTLMVGDSPFDWLCARNAGITSVGVGWSVHLPEKLVEGRPDIIINNFSELISICLEKEV